MLPEQEAVVRPDDQQRVLPEIERVHCVQHVAEVGVALGEERGILAAQVLDPVEERPWRNPDSVSA